MARYLDDITKTIGNTPLVKYQQDCEGTATATVLGKAGIV